MHKLQKKIIELSERENMWSMSFEEIRNKIGAPYRQGVFYHLKQLEKKGLLVRGHNDALKMLKKNAHNSLPSIVNIPIVGTANAGPATYFADESLNGYLTMSRQLLNTNNANNVVAIEVDGNSLDQANIYGNIVESGDYILVDTTKSPHPNDYVLSVINGCANVKKYKFDRDNNRIVLLSESSTPYPPIFIHEDDDYLINGVVTNVVKQYKDVGKASIKS